MQLLASHRYAFTYRIPDLRQQFPESPIKANIRKLAPSSFSLDPAGIQPTLSPYQEAPLRIDSGARKGITIDSSDSRNRKIHLHAAKAEMWVIESRSALHGTRTKLSQVVTI
jgi:hypothetical protein